MSRKASGKQQVSIIKRKQANGSVYVFERISEYNSEKRYYQQVSSRLIGKILPGETEITPTRPKKNTRAAIVDASRTNIGLDHILDWIGRESGIDDDLYSAADAGTAQKILSVVRFWMVNPDRSIQQIEEWQICHQLPYLEGVSADVCYQLMKEIGQNVSMQQSYFQYRAVSAPSKASVAIDSTTIYSYSEYLNDVRYGFNKDKNRLPTVKLLTLFCLENHQPIAFIRQPGNIPDVSSVLNALAQLNVFGMNKPLMVMDGGFFSEENIFAIIRTHTKFLMRGQLDGKWILPELKKTFDSLTLPSNSCPFEKGTYGLTVMVNHTFSYQRERTRGGISKGDTVKEDHRLYLHFFLNVDKASTEKAAFIQDIRHVKEQLEQGVEISRFSKAELTIMDKYLTVNERKGKRTVHMRDDKIIAASQYFGIFNLISNDALDTFTALREYRLREKTEENFRIDKHYNDAHSTRSKETCALDGRFFCQFVAMGYEEHFSNAIAKMKKELAVPNGDPSHDKSDTFKKEKMLLNWLNKMSLAKLLAWFDAVQETTVKTNIGKKRWQTETLERDRLFLERLGVIKPSVNI